MPYEGPLTNIMEVSRALKSIGTNHDHWPELTCVHGHWKAFVGLGTDRFEKPRVDLEPWGYTARCCYCNPWPYGYIWEHAIL
jgi:hypothetical protein